MPELEVLIKHYTEGGRIVITNSLDSKKFECEDYELDVIFAELAKLTNRVIEYDDSEEYLIQDVD